MPELLLSHLPKFIEFYLYSHVTNKNVSWPHFSWTTLYIVVDSFMRNYWITECIVSAWEKRDQRVIEMAVMCIKVYEYQ